MGKPYFFILGVQRGGTTSLWEYFSYHKDCRPANTKTPITIDHGAVSLNPGPIKETSYWSINHSQMPLEIYESLFPDDGRLGYEASPDYFFMPGVPERLEEYHPDAKLIIFLRNPVDRAWSQYWHELNFTMAEHLPFELAIKRKLEDLMEYYHFGYLYQGIYIDHLDRWFCHFNREQILILKSEEFYLNPDREFKRAQMFLQMRDIAGLNHYVKRTTNMPYPKMGNKVYDELWEYFAPYNRALEHEIGISWERRNNEKNKSENNAGCRLRGKQEPRFHRHGQTQCARG